MMQNLVFMTTSDVHFQKTVEKINRSIQSINQSIEGIHNTAFYRQLKEQDQLHFQGYLNQLVSKAQEEYSPLEYNKVAQNMTRLCQYAQNPTSEIQCKPITDDLNKILKFGQRYLEQQKYPLLKKVDALFEQIYKTQRFLQISTTSGLTRLFDELQEAFYAEVKQHGSSDEQVNTHVMASLTALVDVFNDKTLENDIMGKINSFCISVNLSNMRPYTKIIAGSCAILLDIAAFFIFPSLHMTIPAILAFILIPVVLGTAGRIIGDASTVLNTKASANKLASCLKDNFFTPKSPETQALLSKDKRHSF